MLQRRHYEAIAASFLSSKPQGVYPNEADRLSQWKIDALTIADFLAKDNPSFDADVFWAACNGAKRPPVKGSVRAVKAAKKEAVKCG